MLGSITIENEEKVEVFSAFFTVINCKTSYPQDIQPPKLEDRDEEQNKFPPTMQ